MPFTEGESLSTEEFRVLVERAGLSLGPEELDHLRAMFEHYRDRLQALHSVSMADRDLALAFTPGLSA